MEDWQIAELTNIASKGMGKLAKNAPELFGRLADALEAYHKNKAGTLATIWELENALRHYLYDHQNIAED